MYMSLRTKSLTYVAYTHPLQIYIFPLHTSVRYNILSKCCEGVYVCLIARAHVCVLGGGYACVCVYVSACLCLYVCLSDLTWKRQKHRSLQVNHHRTTNLWCVGHAAADHKVRTCSRTHQWCASRDTVDPHALATVDICVDAHVISKAKTQWIPIVLCSPVTNR